MNRRFQMSQQADKYFTAWYGVLDLQTGQLAYAGGGHPPALLVGAGSKTSPAVRLEATGPMVGAFEDIDYPSEIYTPGPNSKIFLYSDGVFEVTHPDGSMWSFEAFEELMARPSHPSLSDMDRLMQFIREYSGKDGFNDDFSIVESHDLISAKPAAPASASLGEMHSLALRASCCC